MTEKIKERIYSGKALKYQFIPRAMWEEEGKVKSCFIDSAPAIVNNIALQVTNGMGYRKADKNNGKNVSKDYLNRYLRDEESIRETNKHDSLLWALISSLRTADSLYKEGIFLENHNKEDVRGKSVCFDENGNYKVFDSITKKDIEKIDSKFDEFKDTLETYKKQNEAYELILEQKNTELETKNREIKNLKEKLNNTKDSKSLLSRIFR